jgi:hypothetical protein
MAYPHPAKNTPYPPYPGFQPYPRVVESSTGHLVTVRDHKHEEQITGMPMNEDGSFADPAPVPPTLQEVLAAGYLGEAAQRIVDEEREKFEKGYAPYGNNTPVVSKATVQVPAENKQVAPADALAAVFPDAEKVPPAPVQVPEVEDPLG